jgi:hypothetical protein
MLKLYTYLGYTHETTFTKTPTPLFYFLYNKKNNGHLYVSGFFHKKPMLDVDECSAENVLSAFLGTSV